MTPQHTSSNTTSRHPHQQSPMSPIFYTGIILLATTLLFVGIGYNSISSTQPSLSRAALSFDSRHHLRNKEGRDRQILDYIMPSQSLLDGPENFFISSPDQSISILDENLRGLFLPSSIWGEDFFSPLLDNSFFEQQALLTVPFEIKESQDRVEVSVTIPDVSLNDINIELIGGRILHIHGAKKSSSSHVTFDKKFSIGQSLDESNLEATLSRDGKLIVSAPKVVDGKKEIRKIPVVETEL